MRELAAVAVARRFSQEALAKAYNERAEASVNGRNVSEHFRAKRPQKETIRTYCEILGLSDEHRRLVEGIGFTDAELDAWSNDVRQRLGAMGAAFNGDVLQAVDDAWTKIGAAAARQSVQLYALVSYRSRLGIVEETPGPFDAALSTFAVALMPTLDLGAMLRVQDVDDRCLWEIWGASLLALGHYEDADVVTNVARALLRSKGFDTGPLDDRLTRERRALEQAVRVKNETPYHAALRLLLFHDDKRDARDSSRSRKTRNTLDTTAKKGPRR